MAKKECPNCKERDSMHMMSVMMLGLVAVVAIVGLSAMFLSWKWVGTTPGLGNAPVWAGGIHAEEQAPGQVKETGGNLRPLGSPCTSDSQCISGSCNIPVSGGNGDRYVCA